MPYKNFNEIPVLTQIIVLLTGLWGAFFSFFRRRSFGKVSLKRALSMFIVDAVSSIGLTTITFLSLTGYGFNEIFAVGVSGFIGHQGTRALYLLELIILEKLGTKKVLEKEMKKDGRL